MIRRFYIFLFFIILQPVVSFANEDPVHNSMLQARFVVADYVKVRALPNQAAEVVAILPI